MSFGHRSEFSFRPGLKFDHGSIFKTSEKAQAAEGAVQSQPESAPFHHTLGRCRLALGEVWLAKCALETALDLWKSAGAGEPHLDLKT